MKSAFLMHPLDLSYVRRCKKYKLHLISKLLPFKILEYILTIIPPFIVSNFKIKNQTSFIVICPLTSKQMQKLPKKIVLKKIIKSCDLAYKKGAKIISLGAYSSIVTNQGLDLIGKTKIKITTGRAMTVFSVMEIVKPYYKKDKKIGVVGGDGAIGNAIFKLSKKFNIIKIEKKNLKDVYSCDIVICASSQINSIINATKLKRNCVVIDVAKPSDISEKINRKDITILKGGLVKLPNNVNFGIDFDCPKNVVYACMAESFILGLDNKCENFCVGKDFDLNLVDKIGDLSKKYNFKIVK